MERLLLDLVVESVQREHLRAAEQRQRLQELGGNPCPRAIDRLLARPGAAIAHTGNRLQRRADCGCPAPAAR